MLERKSLLSSEEKEAKKTLSALCGLTRLQHGASGGEATDKSFLLLH